MQQGLCMCHVPAPCGPMKHPRSWQISLAYCLCACCRYLSQVKESSATEGMRLLYEMGDNARNEFGTAGGVKTFIDMVRAALLPAGFVCSACPCSLSAIAGRMQGLAAELLLAAMLECC